ncbi:MAG TPA: DUF3857 domain-containing protein [Thermoanaerobaculia bacterium]
MSLLCSPTLFAGFSQGQDFRNATPEELAMKGVPSAPGASAVVLDWVVVNDDPNSSASEYVRMKIFSEDGKKFADIEVPYVATYPYNARVSDISARTIRPDGKIVNFDGKVYDKIVYKGGGHAVRAKTFSLPDVQPGSILEYRFQRRWSPNLLLNSAWEVQRELPVVHAKFKLTPYVSPDADLASFFTFRGLPPGKTPQRNPTRDYELELNDIAAFVSEPFAPPETQLKARVDFYYTRSRVQPQEFWTVEAKEISKNVEKFIGKGVSAGGGATLANLQKLYADVQSFRNYSYESEKTSQEIARQDLGAARSARDVVEHKAGYRDEINRAFVALARGAGFDATVVRVPSRDENFFTDRIPDGSQMNAEIAAVVVDGQTRYLDPGTPGAPFGTLAWEKTNVPGIRVIKSGQVEWVKIPNETTAKTIRKAELKLADDVLSGTVTVTYLGEDALVERLHALNDDDAARRKSLEDDVKQWLGEGATATLKNVTGLVASSDPQVVATFDVTAPNLVSHAGSRIVVPLSVFAASGKNPFSAATRVHPIYFAYPYSIEDEVKLTLPAGATIAVLPPPAKLSGGLLNYSNETKAEGNVVTFHRTKSIDGILIETKYYNAIRNFYAAALTADQKPLILQAGQ